VSTVPPAEPPSLRIAADLRARIASGELKPGDPVPSTRQITRQWGVAMATATKALAALRTEGLVEVVRGVGAVVAQPLAAGRRPPRPPAAPAGAAPTLSRERLVSVGIGISDTEGMAAVTMRRLAAEVGAGAMSLYRYVSGKDKLVLLMLDAVFAEEPLPEPGPPGWREKLTVLARCEWNLCRRHPWVTAAQVASFTRPPLVPHAMAHTEWALGALEGLGLDTATRFGVVMAFNGYVTGMARQWALEADAQQDTGMTSDQYLASQDASFTEVFASGRFPHLAALGDDDVMDLDRLFEFGLQLHLDGVATLIARRGRAERP
jgi:AcrR family transcriptional regulator